jgi:hypothetical protein
MVRSPLAAKALKRIIENIKANEIINKSGAREQALRRISVDI